MLTKEECLNELEILCNYADGNPSSSGEFVGRMLQEADDTLQELIEEHFDNQFLDAEVELLISLLKRVEDELGMDITLLIDKLRRIQNTLPKEEGVVTCVEFEID